ncbi:related to stage V sporulation protein K [Cephalotrichum gorgonifer]|uniref:Related to stage V sporulation protein K n=1 Tax=Cephalotrichum gorgonifer TaxID=2041049 RepID=A0AAE8N0K3_9PEZI|nr:related to stage V sporulation protein K [Cephalotrichum gorgonifer]
MSYRPSPSMGLALVDHCIETVVSVNGIPAGDNPVLADDCIVPVNTVNGIHAGDDPVLADDRIDPVNNVNGIQTSDDPVPADDGIKPVIDVNGVQAGDNPINKINGTIQVRNDREGDDYLWSQLAFPMGVSNDFPLDASHRGSTLPFSSQIPTPKSLDDLREWRRRFRSFKPTYSSLSNDSDDSEDKPFSRGKPFSEDKPFSDEALEVMAKLDALMGLDDVKCRFRELGLDIHNGRVLGVDRVDERLHALFQGNPGTGKTTVANLYAQFLKSMDVLGSDRVVETSGAKLASGGPRAITDIFERRAGGVLFVDEAYQLVAPHSGPAGKQVLDVILGEMDSNSPRWVVVFAGYKEDIVSEVQGNPGDDRCVILLEYEDKMESLFQNGNPGLSGRFMADTPFRFADYSREELGEILKLDLKARQIDYEPAALAAATDVLSRSKYNRDFSNARAAKLLVSGAVQRNQERHMTGQNHDEDFEARLEPQDFDPRLRLQATSTGNVANWRADLTGQVSDSVIEQLERYLPTSLSRCLNLNRYVPRTFVLKGPPGTGKTTLANYMGKLFHDIGILPDHRVELCSAISFIGEHVGHTTPKTRKQLERGFGKVLIIRDIHQLAKGGYSSEALDELASFVRASSERMVIVLTGLSAPVNELLAHRPDLGAMFPNRITFQDLSPRDCLNLLDRLIHADEPTAETPFFKSSDATERFQKAMSILTVFEGWGNASLVTVINTRMIKKGYDELHLATTRDPGGQHVWKLTEEMAMSCLEAMLHETHDTAAAVKKIVSEPPASNTCTGETQEIPEPQPTQAMMEATSAPKRKVQATHRVEIVVKDDSKFTENLIKQRDESQKDSERQNQSVQEALKRMGKCGGGLDWDKVPGGYKCRAGACFVSDAAVADAIR